MEIGTMFSRRRNESHQLAVEQRALLMRVDPPGSKANGDGEATVRILLTEDDDSFSDVSQEPEPGVGRRTMHHGTSVVPIAEDEENLLPFAFVNPTVPVDWRFIDSVDLAKLDSQVGESSRCVHSIACIPANCSCIQQTGQLEDMHGQSVYH